MLAVRDPENKKETVSRSGINEDAFVEEREPFISSQERAAEDTSSYLESILPVAPSAPPQMPAMAINANALTHTEARSESKNAPTTEGQMKEADSSASSRWWPSWGGRQQEQKATEPQKSPSLTPQQLDALGKERAKFYREVLAPEAEQSTTSQQRSLYPASIPESRTSSRQQQQSVSSPIQTQASNQSTHVQQQGEQQITPDSEEYLEFMTRDELIEENKRLRKLVQEMAENMTISSQQNAVQTQSQTNHRIKYVSCGHCRQWLQVPFSARIVFCPICSKHSDASGPPSNMAARQQQPQQQRQSNAGNLV